MNRFIQHRAVWSRAAILLLLCIGLAAIASSDRLHEALIEVLAVTEEVIRRHPLAGPSLFVLFAAVSAMFTFVSIAIIVPAAVFAWGMPVSVVLLWLGWILGGVATYAIGRHLGRPVVHWLASGDTFDRVEQRVQHDAPFWLVLLLQTALPSEIPGYVLGLVRYSFPRYLLALGIAELPYTLATVYLGESFVERRGVVVLGAGISIALLSIVAFYFLRRVMRDSGKRMANGG